MCWILEKVSMNNGPSIVRHIQSLLHIQPSERHPKDDKLLLKEAKVSQELSKTEEQPD